MTERVIRVFPSQTSASPTDALAFVGDPPLPVFLPEAERCDISVCFTWEMAEGERLARAWEHHYPGHVSLGGPAFHGRDNRPGDFEPGLYLRKGYVITSRGCPNACPYCLVPEREGKLRELPIRDGWNVLDNNLLACSEAHIDAVFAMLRRQPEQASFTGGFEPRRVTAATADKLLCIRLDQVFLSYDSPSEWEPARAAIRLLRDAGIPLNDLRCYVLAAHDPDDTPDRAAARCEQVLEAGAIPFLMLYRPPVDYHTFRRPDWRDWYAVRRKYSRPAAMLAGGRRAELEAARVRR